MQPMLNALAYAEWITKWHEKLELDKAFPKVVVSRVVRVMQGARSLLGQTDRAGMACWIFALTLATTNRA